MYGCAVTANQRVRPRRSTRVLEALGHGGPSLKRKYVGGAVLDGLTVLLRECEITRQARGDADVSDGCAPRWGVYLVIVPDIQIQGVPFLTARIL